MVALDWVDLTNVTCEIFIGSVMCSILNFIQLWLKRMCHERKEHRCTFYGNTAVSGVGTERNVQAVQD